MGSGAKRAVAHIVLSLDVGGLERVVASLAITQHKGGQGVIVVGLDRAGALAASLPGDEIPVHVVGRRRSGFDPAAVLRLAALLRRNRIRIVHCHNYGALVYGALAARLVRGVRVVYSVHGAITSARTDTARFLKLGLVHAVVFVSAHAREVGRRAGVGEDARVHTIVNGVDVAPFAAAGDGAGVRLAHGIRDDARVCGIVARLTEAKDHATLFAAVDLLRADFPDVRCLVVGDGELRDPLEADVSSRGLQGVVHFAGARSNVHDYLAAMNVFVLSSVTEGLAMTLLEAMAAGLPVVATRVGGNPEAIDEGVTGLLVPASDPRALAEAIAALLSDPERARTMGGAGRRRVDASFSLAAMTARYQAVYEAIFAHD